MKKFIFILVSFMIACTGYAKDVKELIVTTTPPMSCQNCENKIKKNIRWTNGVTKITTSIPDQRVTIEYDADKTNPQQIEEAFNKIGYKVEEIKSSDDSPSSTACQSPTDNCCQKDKNSK